MSRKGNSSGRWLNRQKRDRYVRQAQQEGNVSRAHYKLEQLDERFRLVRRQDQILELGAAPGGWTRYLGERAAAGRVVAVDPLPVVGGANVTVITGWFGEPEVDAEIEALAPAGSVDLVLSDMAPNLSGIRSADQARSIHLADLALQAARHWLKPGGRLVVKLFQGEGTDGWVREARTVFASVKVAKPDASRAESREVYAVCIGRIAEIAGGGV
ncbi:MAG: RlmE family RNA methyltransferase [Pseudomonadales bacterium]|nr:RlmE family RNA methyltransferase [Pseudomonadales bacterium]